MGTVYLNWRCDFRNSHNELSNQWQVFDGAFQFIEYLKKVESMADDVRLRTKYRIVFKNLSAMKQLPSYCV